MFTLSPQTVKLNSTVKINFSKILTDDAVLTVYNSKGQLVKTLICEAGSDTAEFVMGVKGTYTINYNGSSKSFNMRFIVS